MRSLRIGSYFSIETDLAGEMCSWPEFVSGSGYDVDLRDASTAESVTVRYIESGEEAHVHITGSGEGSLFNPSLRITAIYWQRRGVKFGILFPEFEFA